MTKYDVFNGETSNGIVLDGHRFSYDTMNVRSGGTANNTTVNLAKMDVYAGGTANNTVVNSGGSLTVYKGGGTVNHTTVNSGGTLIIYSGSTATDVVWTPCVGKIDAGNGAVVTYASSYSGVYYGKDDQLLESGASISGKKMYSGEMYVFSGGIVSNTSLEGDYYDKSVLYVSSGGRANDTTVNSSGRMAVGKQGIAKDTIVNGGGKLEIFSGGTVSGYLLIASGASVSASQGAVIDLSVAGQTTPTTALINNWSLISGGADADYTLTVKVRQSSGTYTLANGAADFNKSVTVKNIVGTKLGTLSVGETKKFNGISYSLAKNDGTLSLSVVGSAVSPASYSDLDGNGLADIVMTIDKSSNPSNGATGAWLIQSNQTAKWGALSKRGNDWSIFGTGWTAKKSTSDVYLKSTGNVIGAWVTDSSGKVSGWETVGEFDANTEILGLGDFNGNGQSDLLLCNKNGAVGCYFTGGSKTGWNYFQSLGDEWKLCAVGDLNGDGRDDVVLKHDTGFTGSWLTQADGTMKWANLDTLQNGFAIVGCGDFNGDGTDDVLLQKGNYYGAWLVENGNAKGWMGLGDLGNVSVEQIADFNGDGIDDLRIRTANGDLGAKLVMGADNLQWQYYGSVGSEWSTSLAAL